MAYRRYHSADSRYRKLQLTWMLAADLIESGPSSPGFHQPQS